MLIEGVRTAARLEAVASTGGQLVPPVMGAAAFLMAVVAEVEYSAVVLASIVPAVLCYVGLFLQIDLIAARDGIEGERAEGQTVRGELRRGWVFILPFVVLIYGLFALVWRPEYAALMATLVMIVALMSFGHHGRRPTFGTFADAMAGTADAAVSIVFIAALAGIVIGALNPSGVLFNISEAIVDVGGRNLPLLLVLSAIMCIILGMGMPTVGVYALLSTLIAVPLVDLGIDKIAAHLFVLYLGMMSMITPPVAVASFASAAIAGAGPMRTGFKAMRLGWSAYVIPFIFVLNPALILNGTPLETVEAVLRACLGIWLVTAAIVGFAAARLQGGRRAGYALLGMALMVPGHQWKNEDAKVDTPFYGFDHVDLVTGHGDDLGGNYRQWLLERDPEALSKIGSANQLPHDYVCPQAVRTAIPEEHYSTSYVAECAENFIADNDPEQPFFLMVSFPDPHHPFNPPGRYWDMYDPDDMALPEAFARDDWVPPPHVQGRIDARETGSANLAGMDTIGCSAREAQEARALTCGMITMIDDAIGRVLQRLKDSGCDEDTVILFTSDHGENFGDHRLLLKAAECYEQVTRVPFIWRDPAAGSATTGGRTDRIGQTHDIGTSILARAGLAPFQGFQETDVVAGKGREAAIIQYEHQRVHPGLGIPPRVQTLRTDRYRISFIDGVEWGELYDLQTEPGEFDNLWDKPEATKIRHLMTERLLRAEIEATDRVPVPIRQA